MRFGRLLVLSLFACIGIISKSPVLLLAQEPVLPTTMGLRDAVRIALEKNPVVKMAESEVEVQRGLQLDASKRLNPAFTLETENWRPFSSDQGPVFTNTETSGIFSYEIETGGRRALRTRVAELGVESAQAALEDRKRQLILEVERAYFRAVVADADLQVARNILGEIDRIIQVNQVRYAKGEISGGDLKRSEVERLRFADDVFTAQLALRNAKSELLALFSFPDLSRDFSLSEALPVDTSRPIGIPGTASLASFEALQTSALRQRPDLAQAFREQDRADTETLHQRAIRSPNLTIDGGYKRTDGFNTLVLGVTVPLKMFNRNEGSIASAEAELARARNQAALTRTAVLLDLQKAYNTVKTNEERVRYIEQQSLGKSEESRKIVTNSYQLGEANLIDLLDAERAYRETQRTYNQALYEYRISLYELAAAIGEEFPL